MTALAARLQAEATVAGYRFVASRAYRDIVQQRLAAIGEEPHARLSLIHISVCQKGGSIETE